MLAAYFNNKIFFLIEAFLLIFFLAFIDKIVPGWYGYRYWLMFASLSYVGLFVFFRPRIGPVFGFWRKNFHSSSKALVWPTIAVMVAIVVLSFWLPSNYVFPPIILKIGLSSFWFSVIRYIVVSVPLQEVLFRSFLIARAELVIKNKLLLQVYAALIFILMHLMLKAPVLTWGSLILGWIWSGNFIKHRNIYSVILSHVVVGLTYTIFMYLAKS